MAIKAVSKCFLITVNVLMGLIGLSILGGGLYVYLNYSIFEAFLSQDSVLYVACSGAIVFLICLLGLLGVICNQKKFLIPYLFMIILFIAAEVVVGIILLNYLGILDDTAFDISNNKTLDSTEIAINNFILKAYSTCCYDNDEFCSTDSLDPNYCEPVFFCTDIIPQPCIEEDPEDGSTTVDQLVCSTLTGFDLEDGSLLVGPAPDSCGGGDPATFVNNLVTIVKEQLSLAAYVAIGLGIVELLIVMFTTYLLFKGEEGQELRHALSGVNFQNFAVAVGRPVHERDAREEEIEDSIPTAEFEVDMSTIGSRRKSRQIWDHHSEMSQDRRSVRLPGLASDKTEF